MPSEQFPRLESYLDPLPGLTPQARAHISFEAHRMLERLVREVQRIEFSQRHDELDEPEVTASMVMKAVNLLQPAPPLAPRPTHVVVLHAFNLVCAAAAGIMTGHLSGPWSWTLFLAFTASSVAASSYLYRRRWQ